MNETPLQTLERWVSDEDTWIGVFENHDLSSRDCGRKFALPFSLSDGSFEVAELNKTKAPDTKMGLGWRFLLVWKGTDPQEAYDAMGPWEESPDSL